MDRFQYLILMGICLVITLPLEFLFKARVWRRPRRLWAAVWPVAAVLIVWDLIASWPSRCVPS
jgi:lycopene beta-cyclase